MNIELRNGIVSYYGNKAGYVEDDKVVADTLFATPELLGWLAERKLPAEWREGVYDKLHSVNQDAPELKSVRIWQLKPDSDSMMKFIGYDEFRKNFGEPSPEDYEVVYDGSPGTNDPDKIFELFNLSRPEGFTGHSLSMSDVVELYEGGDSEFRFVDRFGFREIAFGGSESGIHYNMAQ